MRPIKKFLVLMVALGTLSVSSCTDDFEQNNIDPNRIESINPGTLLNPIIYEVAAFNSNRSSGFTFDLV